MGKKCKIIYWDNQYHVQGIVATLGSSDELQILSHIKGDANTPFVSQLREVYTLLKCSQAEAIVIGGFLPEFICCDLKMPLLDHEKMRNALEMELSRQVPLVKEEMDISFRILPEMTSNGRKVTVRIFAVRSKIILDLWDQLREANIYTDAFCHPFMASILTAEIDSVEFSETAPNLKLQKNMDGNSELSLCQNSTDIDKTSEAIATYSLNKKFDVDKKYLSNVPDDLKIKRFKKSRNFTIFLIIAIIVSSSIYIYRSWSNQDYQIRAYKSAIYELNSKHKITERRLEEEKKIGLFAEKMLIAMEDIEILHIMSSLSNKLPSNVWVSSFRASGERVSLTLSVKGESSTLNELLNELPLWSVENLRQQQNAENQTWYVTLRRIDK